MKLRNSRGFSLLEMMIVIAIGLTMVGVTFMTFLPLFRKNHVDQAYDITLSAMRTYRNMAIAQGGRYIIVPTAPNTITVQGWGYVAPPGVSPAPVTVATITLPQDTQFFVWSNFPNPGPDTIGTGTSPIYTQVATTGVTDTCSVVEGGVPCVVFYPDGSAQDDAGNYVSMVVYISQPTINAFSSRAIDIWGATGRIRGWRLYPSGASTAWVQQ
jgi:prepilin-type N-terminal cleavage/methylation domain-containing protein